MKGGRHQVSTDKFKKRFVDGGLRCNKCKKVYKLSEYDKNKTYCLYCRSKTNKERHKKSRYKLW